MGDGMGQFNGADVALQMFTYAYDECGLPEVKGDQSEAFPYIVQRAREGDKKAQLLAGKYYVACPEELIDGQSIYDEAKAWLEAAAKDGDKGAEEYLKRVSK